VSVVDNTALHPPRLSADNDAVPNTINNVHPTIVFNNGSGQKTHSDMVVGCRGVRKILAGRDEGTGAEGTISSSRQRVVDSVRRANKVKVSLGRA
jgi:hypothetical protein